jgi:hypothetical protein
MHTSHWQAGVQVCVPPIPQAWVAIGAQTPSPPQADQSDQTPLLQMRVWLPQLPQAWLAGPAQACPPQSPHWQAAVQVCIPALPHAWVVMGAQTPSPPQADQSDQTPLLHVRVCAPQLPQAWLEGPAQV